MMKTKGMRRSIAMTMITAAIIITALGTGIASAYKSSPYGGDEFTVNGVLGTCVATYCWINGNHGTYRCSAQKGDGEIVRSRDRTSGIAIATAFGTGTNRGWYYNYPGTYSGNLGE